MGTLIIALIVSALIGLVLGVVIGIAGRFFGVESDPRIEQVTEMLPGANCGGCGKAGCADFAKALVAGERTPDGCPVNSDEAIKQIAAFLGISTGSGEKQVAVIFCGGDQNRTKSGLLYNGVADCISANLVSGGPKGCTYGCLGMASCAKICPFHAIEMLDGLAVVHDELCTGCGQCVEVCPRHLIRLTPKSVSLHVYCSSPDKGPNKKKVCDVACIGCRKCVKAAEEGQMEINGFLARVNYSNPPGEGLVEKAGCPTGCLKTSVAHYQQGKAGLEVV